MNTPSIVPRLLFAALPALSVMPVAEAQPYAYIPNTNANTVTVLDTTTDTIVRNLTVGWQPQSVAILKDGSAAYVTSSCTFSPSTVSKIDAATLEVTTTTYATICPLGSVLSPDNRHLYLISGGSPGSVVALDLASGTLGHPIAIGNMPLTGTITRDGSRLYVINRSTNSISVVDTASETMIDTIPIGSGAWDPFVAAVSPDGTRLYVALDASHKLATIDTQSKTLVGTPISITGANGVAVSPDGAEVYVTGEDFATGGNYYVQKLFFIDTALQSISASVELPLNSARSIGLTSDGRYAYVQDCTQNAASLALVDLLTRTLVGTVPGPQNECTSDGGFVAPSDVIFRDGFD